MGGQSDKVAGKIKEVTGDITGDRDLESEGKRQGLAGDIKKAGESVKRKADEIGDKVKR